MEADSNASYNKIFGNHMLGVVRSQSFMLEEIYTDQGKTADDCYIAKVILDDIVRQERTSTAIISIDATDCYSSIAYAIASLVFQAFVVPLE